MNGRIILLALILIFTVSCSTISNYANAVWTVATDRYAVQHDFVEDFIQIDCNMFKLYVDPCYTPFAQKKIQACLCDRLSSFMQCLRDKGIGYNLFRMKIKDYTVYVMPQKNFPCNSSTGLCAGMHIESTREIFLAKNGDAWEWELKNVWARTERKDTTDPDPSKHGLDECVISGECLQIYSGDDV